VAVERGNVLHHVNREGELPGRGNVRGEYIRGNMSTGNAWTPAIAGEVLLKVACIGPGVSRTGDLSFTSPILYD